MRYHAFRQLRIEHLWFVAALVLVASIGALVPIDQLDFWWHLALGREISQTGTVPTTSSHSWVLPPHTPFIYGSWLAEWLFFQLYQRGGLPLLVLVRNLLLLALLALVGLDARRRGASWRLAALAVAGLGLTLLNNVSVRPQIFAWLPFALTLLLLGAVRSRQLALRTLLVLPLLMAWWVNVHGTFTLGLALSGLTALGESFKYARHRDHELRSPLIWLWGITAACAATVLINPRATDIAIFVRNLVFHPAAQGGGEWQRTDLLAYPGFLMPVALLLIGVGWYRRRDRFDLTDALILAVFTWFGWSAIRSLIWFAIVAWPIAAGALAAPAGRPARKRVEIPAINYAILGVLIVAWTLTQPSFKPLLPLPPPLAGWATDAEDGWLIDATTPVHAVAWLQQHPLPPDARLFNDLTYGSYLIWALPEVKVAADGRLELYPLEHWLQYTAIMRAEQSVERLDQLGTTHAMLSRDRSPELVARLQSPASGWQQLYLDETTAIFARREAGP
jgi:hypothetical protein